MRSQQPLTDDGAANEPSGRRYGVLVTEDEPVVRQFLSEALDRDGLRVYEAGSLQEARQWMGRGGIDLALVDLVLPDGDGLELAGELHAQQPRIPSVVVTGEPSLNRAVGAMRAGVCDFLAKPVNLKELRHCVSRALAQRQHETKISRRIQRLHQLCRKLNRARMEVGEQVDILCNDLIGAYQELAGQMQHVQMIGQFKAQIEQELGLEQLLRRLLEFVLQQTGPTNAAVFMPDPEGGFSVGGYINYSFDRSEVETMLDQLAVTVAPRLGEAERTVHLSSPQAMESWLGQSCGWLDGCQAIGMPCRYDDETLAVLLLFRGESEPYSTQIIESLDTMGSLLAGQLTKVIHVHHRHISDPEDAEDEGSSFL